MSYQYPLLVTNIHKKKQKTKKTKHEKFDGGLSNTIEKLVSGAGAPSGGTFPARGLEPIKIVARSNHNKLQYGGRRYLSFGPGKFSYFFGRLSHRCCY